MSTNNHLKPFKLYTNRLVFLMRIFCHKQIEKMSCSSNFEQMFLRSCSTQWVFSSNRSTGTPAKTWHFCQPEPRPRQNVLPTGVFSYLIFNKYQLNTNFPSRISCFLMLQFIFRIINSTAVILICQAILQPTTSHK